MWLAADSISLASIGIFQDACAGVAGLLQIICSIDGVCVTMCWHGIGNRAVSVELVGCVRVWKIRPKQSDVKRGRRLGGSCGYLRRSRRASMYILICLLCCKVVARNGPATLQLG